MSLHIPKTLWAPYLRNQQREFHPVLVIDVFESIDMPIRFWDERSKVKVTAGNVLTEHKLGMLPSVIKQQN